METKDGPLYLHVRQFGISQKRGNLHSLSNSSRIPLVEPITDHWNKARGLGEADLGGWFRYGFHLNQSTEEVRRGLERGQCQTLIVTSPQLTLSAMSIFPSTFRLLLPESDVMGSSRNLDARI